MQYIHYRPLILVHEHQVQGQPLLIPASPLAVILSDTLRMSLCCIIPFPAFSARHNVLWSLCIVEYKPEKISQDYFHGGSNGEGKQLCSLRFPSDEFLFIQKYPSGKSCAHLLVHRADRPLGLSNR